MGICFVGERPFAAFLGEYIEHTPGDYVSVDDGRVIGSIE